MEEFDFSQLEQDLSDATIQAHTEQFAEGAAAMAGIVKSVREAIFDTGLDEELAQMMAARYMNALLYVALREGEI